MRLRLTEEPSLLIGLKGRRDSAVVTGRLVVVYDGEAQFDAGALSEHKSLSHQIPETDQSRFAKEYLLYVSAAEISQDVLSQLYRVFIQGEGHYFFQDDLISADLLAAFVGMEHLIAQQFASAA